MKVIAFPFAGGNKYSFDFFKPYLLNNNISLEVFEYPGRGQRMRENLIASMEAVVNDLFPKVLSSINNDEDSYIIYGHSMGAIIAYLICEQIERRKDIIKPKRMIVSGRTAPSIFSDEITYHLPSDIFWEKVFDMGGVPEGIIKESAIKDFYEPILRNDFKAIEEYEYEEAIPLSIPIDVLYGDEECKNKKDFLDWSQETTNEVNFYTFKGNHFFVHNYAQDIANHFIQGFR